MGDTLPSDVRASPAAEMRAWMDRADELITAFQGTVEEAMHPWLCSDVDWDAVEKAKNDLRNHLGPVLASRLGIDLD